MGIITQINQMSRRVHKKKFIITIKQHWCRGT
uniref:Uncharacterized protein n=1 Tax=Rhizophora mucronata TaxID=61149 RepID=A0A2P2Q921_RHIMU